MIIFMLLPSAKAPAQEIDYENERYDTIPADRNRYLYLKKKLYIEFDIRIQQNSYFGPILQINSNDNEFINFFLDYQIDDIQQLIVYSRENIRKLRIPHTENNAETNPHIKIEFDQKEKDFIVQISDTMFIIDNLDFDPKAGYKFSFPSENKRILDMTGEQAIRINNIQFIEVSDRKISRNIWYWFLFILIIDLLIFGIVQLRRRLLRKKQAISATNNSSIINDEPELIEITSPTKNAIYLLGGFNIYDSNGENITKKFTPLLKELLLLIIIYTPEKGITSEKLREILWFDKSEQSAKNNRAVNFGKLRTLLETVGNIEITNKTGRWEFILNDENTYIDYYEYINLLQKGKVTERQEISKLLQLTRKGPFLPDTHYEWLDKFKSKITDYCIDTLTHYLENHVNINKEPDLALKIADSIFNFDHLNEFALQTRINAYAALGKHSLAKKCYEKFTKDYSSAYGEKFDKSFGDLR